MIKNKNAFSLVIAMWLVLIMTMLVLYILEYMIPYSKNVKWIENSSNAFYQAENSIEEWLYFFSKRWGSTKFDDNSVPFTTWSGVSYKYNTTSSWTSIPYNWEWNSEFDIEYNTISPWNPIQLDIWNDLWILWGNSATRVYFNIPDLDNTSTETLSWNTLAIINWQISAENDTLNATGSWIKANEIDWSAINLLNRQWQNLNWDETSTEKFWNFYSTKCWNNKKCSLKFSIINKLELDSNNTSVPYLEYKITTDKNIPLRFSRIKSSGKSYGFQKHLEVRIPQQTTNEAFDFTVFQ
jgi:hypothetical protein